MIPDDWSLLMLLAVLTLTALAGAWVSTPPEDSMPDAPPFRCLVRQYSDQMHCPACRLTWDTNDPDPPACNRGVAVEEINTKSRKKHRRAPA